MQKLLLIVIITVISSAGLYANEPEQKFHGFNLQGYDESGEMTWEVNGDTADIVGSEIILSNVDANTFGDEKMNIVAEIGIVDQTTGKMHLEKDVVITSQSGQKLLTDSLDWNRTEDLVTTQDDVMITGDKMMVTGTGMRAKPGLKRAKIHKDVTVIIDTEQDEKKESKKLTITSDGPMVIDQEKSIATFDENVVAYQDDQTLRADHMEIHFDQEMSGIQKMVCTGNVEIEQGANKSYAQKAVYIAASKKLILSGRPKLILLTEGGGLFAASGN